jgi:hypothetical protein
MIFHNSCSNLHPTNPWTVVPFSPNAQKIVIFNLSDNSISNKREVLAHCNFD